MSDIISRRRGPAEGWEDAFASGGNLTGAYDLIIRRRGPAEGWEDAFASGGKFDWGILFNNRKMRGWTE